MSFFDDFLSFLKSRKKLWMLPLFLFLLATVGLLVLSQGSVFAPFIYSIF